MSKLWQKNEDIDNIADIFCTFTTGNDYQLDQTYFLKHDIIASKVWADALYTCEIYTEIEVKQVKEALDKIMDSYKAGTFTVQPEDEDGHTAIENALVKLVGNLGKKIHTGRSRNDQSLTMIRMFMTDTLREIRNSVTEFSDKLTTQFKADSDGIFIGYSHTQQAMPTTIGHYFAAHAESLVDDAENLASVHKHIDKCPLGTGAGFGSPLDVNRHWIAHQLGFQTFQNNSLYCQNSRGKFELLYIQAMSQVMLSLQRLATDMILYTSREYSLFKMSDSLSQGSSMMPQKKNPDVFEMIRAKTSDVLALEEKVKFIIKGLPSGYNRDLQEIKACIVDAYNITRNCIYIAGLAIEHIKPDMEAIYSRLTKDIVSADYAINMCIEDSRLNFRDLYRYNLHFDDVSPHEAIGLRKSKGSPGNM